ncbi:type IV pilus inner membrane component PilO [Alkalimarinus alittae]|uniref:Type 4a pilus biogenesis protein PilO n=1 Tax=Alkalimarinus alittae TaxID=2961619 RepID=A0ABY6N0N2_9ALTE|nr:type 4a pilus biogenesis protein PilO [Alkalimarinus alittae]UZE95639.1 type 4a pilus biogenesis protein PilO [Alkalimarinus alittae]
MSFAESLESLKNFDVNDLDFNNAGSWPGPIKAIVSFIVVALVVGGGYWFLIQDQITQLDQVASKEAELKQQFETKAYKVANLAAYKLQMLEMEESFGALLKQLPTDTEVPGLLEDITNTGLGSGLEFKEIKLKPETKKEFYIELPIQIAVKGTYHDIASFVSGVASLPRIVTLHDFSITPEKGGEGIMSMSIEAKTYRYKAGRKGK